MLLVVLTTGLLQIYGSKVLRREPLLKEASRTRLFAQQRDNFVPHSKQRPVIGLRKRPITKIENPISAIPQQHSKIANSHAAVCFASSSADGQYEE